MMKQYYRILAKIKINLNSLLFGDIPHETSLMNFQHVSAHLGPYQGVIHNTVGSITNLTLYATTYLVSYSFTKNPSYNTSINFLSVHEDPNAFLRECRAYVVECLWEGKNVVRQTLWRKIKSARPSLFWDVARRRLIDGHRRFGTTSVQLQGPSSPTDT